MKQTPRTVADGTAKLYGHYNAEQKLRLVFGLRPPHPAEEEQFLRDLQDRDSPLFHQYLSQEEWNARFAPSAQDEQAVVDWAKSEGLTVTQRYPNRLLVDVEATVVVIEKALDVSINLYQSGDTSFYSNDRDPSIPSHLTGVVHSVLGLNNLEVAHPASTLRKQTQRAGYFASELAAAVDALRVNSSPNGIVVPRAAGKDGIRPDMTNGAYDPDDIYSSEAYNYQALRPDRGVGYCCNPLGDSAAPPEASIAITGWGVLALSDIYGFHSQYTDISYNVAGQILVDGGPACCDDGANSEMTLDAEWAAATANSFASGSDTTGLWLYEGADGKASTLSDVINQANTDGHARVLNMSWSSPEHTMSTTTMDTFHNLFNQMTGAGWTLVASAGDQGASKGCGDYLSVAWPAADPDVVAAGGTTLTWTSNNTYYSEVGWTGGTYSGACQDNNGGSGGGCSAYFQAPDYQTNQACPSSYRSVPDIALNANAPQNYYFNGSLQPTGGTSIVAPELSGFFAQENAYLLYLQSDVIGKTCGGSGNAACVPLGNANPYIYYLGNHPSYAAHYAFYDITSGCNSNNITQLYGLTPYCAVPGYDRVTGWGSANMLQLAWGINTYLAGDFGAPYVTYSGPPTNRWYNTNQRVDFSVTDTSQNGHPPNGVAGWSGYWDSDPGDPQTEPTPGQGNSYYSGPLFPKSTSGYGDLNKNGEGWHSVHVRAWDNAGLGSIDYTYGPLGYDITPPTTTTNIQQGKYYQTSVQVTLGGTDNLSGVANTNYQIDSGAWITYTAPFTLTALGPHTLMFYSTDNAGNIEAAHSVYFAIIGTTQYTLSVSKAGSGSGQVTSTDGNLNCGNVCSHAYYAGTPVTLTPVPSQGSVFMGWTGCDSLSQNNCTVVVLSAQTATATFIPAVALGLVPVTPCRVADTRNPSGPFGGPPIQGHSSRDFVIPNSACGIPTTATAYSLNVTVVPRVTLEYLTAWPTGQPQPFISTLNSIDGRVKANAAIVPAGTNGAISVYVTDTTDVILDIDGYFEPVNGSTLAFFPLTPCRVIDTRSGMGGQTLSGGPEYDYKIQGICGIPSSAQAYSFNFTVVPISSVAVGYLTVWPQGQNQPYVSTLNDPTGTIVANAAIVPAGNGGEVSAYAYTTGETDLIVDVNGYFAPANSGSNPLSLYALLPCRVLDTRLTTGAFNGEIITNVGGSFCAVPSAKAYALNATVVPRGVLDYLALWPDGQSQPVVSTLNAIDGAITSNMAIVPTNNGYIDAYANGVNGTTTDLILDIFSYFAP